LVCAFPFRTDHAGTACGRAIRCVRGDRSGGVRNAVVSSVLGTTVIPALRPSGLRADVAGQNSSHSRLLCVRWPATPRPLASASDRHGLAQPHAVHDSRGAPVPALSRPTECAGLNYYLMNAITLRALERAEVETHAVRHDASKHHLSTASWAGGALDENIDAFGQGMGFWHDASLKQAGAQHSRSPIIACEVAR
jgi:hypothetical protein